MVNATQASPTLPDTGYIRLTQILQFIPVGRSSWWAGVKSGRFPKGYILGPKTTAWRVEDIRELLTSFEQNNVQEG